MCWPQSILSEMVISRYLADWTFPKFSCEGNNQREFVCNADAESLYDRVTLIEWHLATLNFICQWLATDRRPYVIRQVIYQSKEQDRSYIPPPPPTHTLPDLNYLNSRVPGSMPKFGMITIWLIFLDPDTEQFYIMFILLLLTFSKEILFKLSNYNILLFVPRRCFFCGSFMLLLSCILEAWVLTHLSTILSLMKYTCKDRLSCTVYVTNEHIVHQFLLLIIFCIDQTLENF